VSLYGSLEYLVTIAMAKAMVMSASFAVKSPSDIQEPFGSQSMVS
jgi:hypothetical protein